MSEAQSRATDTRPSELRSIAKSIEYAFPSAAETLRGIARDLERATGRPEGGSSMSTPPGWSTSQTIGIAPGPDFQPPNMSEAFCADCLSLMLEDDGAGHLCPVCDVHDDCDDFPCSGESGTRVPLCALRRPLT